MHPDDIAALEAEIAAIESRRGKENTHPTPRLLLYLVERTDSVGYNEYEGMLVLAADAAEARRYHPAFSCTDQRYARWLAGERGWGWVASNACATLRVLEMGIAHSAFQAGAFFTAFRAA